MVNGGAKVEKCWTRVNYASVRSLKCGTQLRAIGPISLKPVLPIARSKSKVACNSYCPTATGVKFTRSG